VSIEASPPLVLLVEVEGVGHRRRLAPAVLQREWFCVQCATLVCSDTRQEVLTCACVLQRSDVSRKKNAQNGQHRHKNLGGVWVCDQCVVVCVSVVLHQQ
jgi:hypothetical protein